MSTQQTFRESEKQHDVRRSNILAGRAVADLICTSLGPRGMDKMIQNGRGETEVTNDGATVMAALEVRHPAALMMVEMSKAQDIEAGDGTTSVVVVAGSLLKACEELLEKGIHPTAISEAFIAAEKFAEGILKEVSIPLDLSDRESLIQATTTSLSSKVVAAQAPHMAELAVDAVLRVIDNNDTDNVDLSDINVVKQLGGTVDQTELIEGLVIKNSAINAACGPVNMKNARVALIQYQLSPPKPYMDSNVVIENYNQMDRAIKEEKKYIAKVLKPIKKAKCNVLLIQKSILRDAVTDLSLHFLAKAKIMVVKDVERSDIGLICKTLNIRPVAHPASFSDSPDHLCIADLAASKNKLTAITGIKEQGKTVSIIVRGSNNLVLDEAERSLHDALCVVRSLVKTRFLLVGGGAAEMQICHKLNKHADTLEGVEQYCFKAFANAFEIIPFILAQNCGLNAIEIVTEMRSQHAAGNPYAGINVDKGSISDMKQDHIVQPLLVTLSSLRLAVETVTMILKVDDLIPTR